MRNAIDSPLSTRWTTFQDWFTPARFAAAWHAARAVADVSVSSLFIRLGVSLDGRTVYRWLNGESVPSWNYAARIDELFGELLGAEWMEKYDFL